MIDIKKDEILVKECPSVYSGVKSYVFWKLAIFYTLGCALGLLIIGSYKDYAKKKDL